MHGTHNGSLVVFAILIAAATSYTALDLAGRFSASSSPTARTGWLSGAAFSLGGGIWSMHFVAMLAYSMPEMRASYDVVLTALSFALAVGATGAGFLLTSKFPRRRWGLVLSGLIMGLGIAAMHYTGMAALQNPMVQKYEPIWVTISLVVAIGAATAALWLAFMNTGYGEKAIAAIVMGAAISGMHFAGMRAASFLPMEEPGDTRAIGVNQETLAISVSAITFLVLSLALLAALVDRRLALQSKREAELLRGSEERFRLLYRRTPLPLHAVDADDQIIDVSDAWLNLFGFDRHDVIGRSIRTFMTPASSKRRADVTWPMLMNTGEVRNAESSIVTRHQAIIDVEITGRVERSADGRFASCIEGLVDVTARKKAEEVLRQTQKMETLGQLTGGVAHDFNNLLAVILGNLELLRKQRDMTDRSRHLIDTSIQGVQRGTTLTQRMLAFARRQSLDPTPVDVVSLIRGMEGLLKRSLGPHFELLLPKADFEAVATVDENHLEMALLNLVVNARDAMPNGGLIGINVRPPNDLSADGMIAIEVVDHGLGMDARTLARATEPFFTTKGPLKGTGLGLSMVHGFALQSGGRLDLESTLGGGTRATILLPAAPALNASVSRQPAETQPQKTQALPLCILAVDDDFLVLMSTQAMLEDLGHKVLTAQNGDEALHILDKIEDVDLIITDQAMPKMTGLQLAELVHTRRPELPIILATGYAELKDDSRQIAVKLDKPYWQNQLETAIAGALRQSTR